MSAAAPTARDARARRANGGPRARPGPGDPPGFAVEATPIGPQSLVPGVVPISARDRLDCRAAAPLAPTKPQRPCDLGLFDLNARNQLDLFQPKEA